MNPALEQLVWRRADARCEYCRLPQAASPLPHAIDHIIARQHHGRTVAETTSDNYGDFKFDRLDENSGRYLIEISAPGRPARTVEANLGASINLGEIRL